MTAEEIKVKSETDDIIKKMKNQVRFKENKTGLPGCNFYSICHGMLIYTEHVIHCKKEYSVNSIWGHLEVSRMKSLMRSCVLAKYGQRYRKDCEKL